AYPNAHPAYYELGLALAAAGEPERAIAALRAVTRLTPEHAGAWWTLGMLLFEVGDAANAEAALAGHQVARLTDPRLKPLAAAVYGGRPAEAEAPLGRLLTMQPNNLAALDLLAEAVTRLGRHDEASPLLEKLLERRPGDDQARFRLARSLYQQ